MSFISLSRLSRTVALSVVSAHGGLARRAGNRTRTARGARPCPRPDAVVRVPARARWAPGARRARRTPVPRRRELGAGRVPRRRRLLRAERLPHHLTPRRRMANPRPNRLRGVLGPPGATAPPCAPPRRHRRRRVRRVRRASGRAGADPRRRARLIAVRRQLAPAVRIVVLRQ